MKFLEERQSFGLGLFIALGLLMPTHTYASSYNSVPEPISLMLLGTGLAGLGAAELIRRRRRK